MAKSLFLIKGNICAERVRLGRALQKPPMTQDDLARKIQFMGMDMTPLIISRIEKNQRHVCDAELRILAKALGVTMDSNQLGAKIKLRLFYGYEEFINMKYNELATVSGVTPSTVYSLMDASRKDLSVITLKKLCDGLDMTITEFFDDELFKTLEQEIR